MSDALEWCLRHFKHLDEANAAIHCARVRYSPITFRLAAQISGANGLDEEAYADARAVLLDQGQYTPDPGR